MGPCIQKLLTILDSVVDIIWVGGGGLCDKWVKAPRLSPLEIHIIFLPL